MPAGGRSALIFWGGLTLLLAVGLLYLYRGFAVEERHTRLLKDDQQRLMEENTKLRAEVDTLQTELSQTGSMLKNREQILRETTESLQQVKAQNDQADQLADQQNHARADLQDQLAKAVQAIDPAPPADSFKIWIEGDHVSVRLANSLLFDGSDTVLNAKGADLLKKLGAALKTAAPDQEIVIDGYTDSTPAPAAATATTPAPKPPNLWDVSARRASAVVRVLADAGISPDRLIARGLGASHPVAPNDGPDHLKNRRIEIVVRPLSMGAPTASVSTPVTTAEATSP